jgi:predicted nucleic acid-binding protein
MADYVFDSFALIAYFKNEPAAPIVENLLRDGDSGAHALYITAANLGEVAYRVYQELGEEASEQALSKMLQWPMLVVTVDQRLALKAASLKAIRGLGYLDCFAAALADRLKGIVATGDRDFEAVEDLVQIHWLPRRPR